MRMSDPFYTSPSFDSCRCCHGLKPMNGLSRALCAGKLGQQRGCADAAGWPPLQLRKATTLSSQGTNRAVTAAVSHAQGGARAASHISPCRHEHMAPTGSQAALKAPAGSGCACHGRCEHASS